MWVRNHKNETKNYSWHNDEETNLKAILRDFQQRIRDKPETEYDFLELNDDECAFLASWTERGFDQKMFQ